MTPWSEISRVTKVVGVLGQIYGVFIRDAGVVERAAQSGGPSG